MVNKADSACLIENNAIQCIIRNKVNNCANNGAPVSIRNNVQRCYIKARA